MTSPDPRSTAVPAAPASAWTEPARPVDGVASGFMPSAFGPTLFDALAAPAPSRPASGTVFDVCHVGVVLRALLLVHGALAIGVGFVVVGFEAWLAAFALSAAVGLPGVLFWLIAACLGKRQLAVLPVPGQWAAAVLLGAVSGGSASLLASGAVAGLLGGGHGPAPLLVSALAGAALAAVMFQWLHLRAQALLPAETAARLAELQSRIRPHFLFNTLNTALALVRLDPAQAERVLEDLAELFRVALSDSGASVSLAEEVELAQRYLAIEQIRFGRRLTVNWELDPAAGAARVPPLLLQPLVENAVRHGVEPADEGGVIRVRTRVRMGRAVLSIANGVPPGPSRPGHGMALRNVRERLRLMHDVAAQFETRHEANVFRVQIVVPL